LLVGDSTGAPTRVICSADSRSASAVCNCGGDRAIFHATMEDVVIDSEDVLAWRRTNVRCVGNCVQFT
jgi:hypothetical protein